MREQQESERVAQGTARVAQAAGSCVSLEHIRLASQEESKFWSQPVPIPCSRSLQRKCAFT